MEAMTFGGERGQMLLCPKAQFLMNVDRLLLAFGWVKWNLRGDHEDLRRWSCGFFRHRCLNVHVGALSTTQIALAIDNPWNCVGWQWPSASRTTRPRLRFREIQSRHIGRRDFRRRGVRHRILNPKPSLLRPGQHRKPSRCGFESGLEVFVAHNFLYSRSTRSGHWRLPRSMSEM